MKIDEWRMMESLREIFFEQTEYIYSTFDVRRSSVSFSIKLAVFLASGAACMNLHENIKANRRISNAECLMSKDGNASLNHSTVPSFHVASQCEWPQKMSYFQLVIEIPRRSIGTPYSRGLLLTLSKTLSESLYGPST
jgi:hypothetical protein